MLCSLGPAAHVADCRQLTATSVDSCLVHSVVKRTPYTGPGNTKLPPLLRNPRLSPTSVTVVRLGMVVTVVTVVTVVAASSECSL